MTRSQRRCVAFLDESHTKTIRVNILKEGPPSPWEINVIPSDPIRCHPRQTCHRPFKCLRLKDPLFAAEKIAWPNSPMIVCIGSTVTA